MKKHAGILYQGATFRASAGYAESYLRRHGFETQCFPFQDPSTLANLPRFRTKVDLMAWYAHGGWDGPLVFVDLSTPLPFQAAPHEAAEWRQLGAYFGQQVRTRGVFVAHCCHSAGSDSWEKSRDRRRHLPPDDRVWVRDVARDMGVYAVGQAGSAGAANVPTVRAMLDFALGGASGMYPFRAFAPGGTRTTHLSSVART